MKRKKVPPAGRRLRGVTWAPKPAARPDRPVFRLTEAEEQFEALPRSIYPPGRPPTPPAVLPPYGQHMACLTSLET